MPATVANAIKVLEERSGEDPALAEAVVFLAGEAEGPEDPFGRPAASVERSRRCLRFATCPRRPGRRSRISPCGPSDRGYVVRRRERFRTRNHFLDRDPRVPNIAHTIPRVLH